MKTGYARCSTNESKQDIERQVRELKQAGAERVFQVMDEQPEKDDAGAKDVQDVEGNIDMEDVTFSYVPGKPVLKHATITAHKGEQVAIVGPTGAGKTTIISLLTRFYDKDSGSILIDGTPIEEITRNSLRRRVGMVLQDTYLFSETVRENIRYGRLDATDEEVEQAARMANAHSFIIHLPQGYDTVLADNAGNISQGQRQLLAIARAILADPDLLILDEVLGLVEKDIITEDDLKALLECRGDTDVILTGITLNDEICVLADEVSKIETVKFKVWD